MKKLLMMICGSFLAVWSINAVAGDIGVVNMQKIFQTSPKAKSISSSLKSQFDSRRQNIVKMSQDLQNEVKNFQKNQAVLNKAKLAELEKKIGEHSTALRQAQSKFQSDFVEAQNKQMAAFLDEVKAASAKVADKKGLDLVVPNNAVLYAKNKLDITSDVMSAMK